jgi:hypothetical protein
MQNLFIKKEDEFVIKFYVAIDKEGTVWSDSKEESLKEVLNPDKEYEIESYSVTFKKPSFGDSVNLYNDIFKTTDGSNIEFNPLTARYQKICLLIKDWSLVDEEGNKISPNPENVKKLHPMIANTIGLQLDAVTGGILS